MNKQNSIATVDRADIVIVGNGIAGLTAAVEARRLDPDVNVVIVTNQSHPTINTPALKQFAIGKLTREQLLAYPAGTERLQRIHVVNATAEEICAQEGYLRLAGGQGLGYNSLLLSTGNRPTGLPAEIPGRDFDGVLTLHRLYDYLDLRRRLPEVEEAVVIGGGAHAVETAMGLLHWGIRVHWLIRSEAFMPRMLDRPASDMVLEGVRRAGAKVYTETEAVGIVGRVGVVAGVVTTTQQMLPCQLVLVCTGTAAVTNLARNCDLPMKHDRGGILVDDHLHTSVRNIYAAGDVASLPDPLTGQHAPRAQWYAAVLQGRTAAAMMTGSEEVEGFGVPWHATRLGDLSMLTVGNPLALPKGVTPLTERRKGSYYMLSLVDDRLVGYLALGSAQPDSLAIKRIIDEGLSVREITRDLLRGEFDARKYFSGKRTYAAQRMITTGQLPTPVPSLSDIRARESRVIPALPAPRTDLVAARAEFQQEQPRGDTAVRLNAMPPVTAPRGDTAARLNAMPPVTAPRGDTAARLNAMPPVTAPRGDTAARLNAMPPVTAPRGDTAARLNAMPPVTAPRGDTAARLNAMPVTAPRGDTAARLNAMPPTGTRREESEAWVNRSLPTQPQGAPAGGGWLNDAPSPTAPPMQSGERLVRRTEAPQRPATEPLVGPMRTGSRVVTGPHPPVRHTDEQRRRIADQKTLLSMEPERTPGRDAEKKPEEVVELVARPPDRQFIAPPTARARTQPEEASNPHPSRSLWHYTSKHPAVKGKKHV